MLILFILGLLLGAVAVTFALQNIEVVTVTFFSYQIAGSLAVVLLLSMGVGILIAFLMMLPSIFKSHMRLRDMKRDNKKLLEDLKKEREVRVFEKHTEPTRQDIKNIESGVIEERSLLS